MSEGSETNSAWI